MGRENTIYVGGSLMDTGWTPERLTKPVAEAYREAPEDVRAAAMAAGERAYRDALVRTWEDVLADDPVLQQHDVSVYAETRGHAHPDTSWDVDEAIHDLVTTCQEEVLRREGLNFRAQTTGEDAVEASLATFLAGAA